MSSYRWRKCGIGYNWNEGLERDLPAGSIVELASEKDQLVDIERISRQCGVRTTTIEGYDSKGFLLGDATRLQNSISWNPGPSMAIALPRWSTPYFLDNLDLLLLLSRITKKRRHSEYLRLLLFNNNYKPNRKKTMVYTSFLKLARMVSISSSCSSMFLAFSFFCFLDCLRSCYSHITTNQQVMGQYCHKKE